MLSETRSVLGAAREMVVDGKAAEAGPASGAATLAASTAPAAFLALQRSVGNRGAVATARQIGAIPRVHIARCAGDCTCGGRCTEDELLPEPLRERAVKVSRAGLDRTAQAQLAACVATRNRPCEPVRAAPSQRAGVRRRPTRRMLQRSPGSPAGGCGVCYGSPRNAGIMAHAIIEAAFRAAYGFQVLTELEFLLRRRVTTTGDSTSPSRRPKGST